MEPSDPFMNPDDMSDDDEAAMDESDVSAVAEEVGAVVEMAV